MPLALEPNELFEIILKSDKDKPRDQQPRFIYRYLTGRQWRNVARIQDKLEELKNADQVVDKVYEAATTGLVGWVNINDPQSGPITFDTEKLEDVVGIIEAQELIIKLMKQSPVLSDKKKLDSPSDSDTAVSAKDVKAPKNAKTNRQ